MLLIDLSWISKEDYHWCNEDEKEAYQPDYDEGKGSYKQGEEKQEEEIGEITSAIATNQVF